MLRLSVNPRHSKTLNTTQAKHDPTHHVSGALERIQWNLLLWSGRNLAFGFALVARLYQNWGMTHGSALALAGGLKPGRSTVATFRNAASATVRVVKTAHKSHCSERDSITRFFFVHFEVT